MASASSTSTAASTDRLPETNNGIVTSWIPMSTDRAAMTSCDQLLWQVVPSTIAAWDPGYGLSVDGDVTCHPRPITTWWLAANAFGSNPYTSFSIGPLSCPDGYYTAKSSVRDEHSTKVACCPSNYVFQDWMDPGRTGECTSDVPEGGVLTWATRVSGTWITTTSAMSEATYVAGIPINGWTFAEATGTATATSASGGGGGGVTAACSSTASAGSAMSSSTAAGVGVGVSLSVTGFAALAAGVFMMLRARRAARAARGGGEGGLLPPPSPPPPSSSAGAPGIYSSHAPPPPLPPGTPYSHELDNRRGNYELDNPPYNHELDSAQADKMALPMEQYRDLHWRGPGAVPEMEGDFQSNVKVGAPEHR